MMPASLGSSFCNMPSALSTRISSLLRFAMFDLVPFARACREVTDFHNQSRRIGQPLQFQSPESSPWAMTASAVGSDQQTSRTWKPLAGQAFSTSVQWQQPRTGLLFAVCRFSICLQAVPACLQQFADLRTAHGEVLPSKLSGDHRPSVKQLWRDVFLS